MLRLSSLASFNMRFLTTILRRSLFSWISCSFDARRGGSCTLGCPHCAQRDLSSPRIADEGHQIAALTASRRDASVPSAGVISRSTQTRSLISSMYGPYTPQCAHRCQPFLRSHVSPPVVLLESGRRSAFDKVYEPASLAARLPRFRSSSCRGSYRAGLAELSRGRHLVDRHPLEVHHLRDPNEACTEGHSADQQLKSASAMKEVAAVRVTVSATESGCWVHVAPTTTAKTTASVGPAG